MQYAIIAEFEIRPGCEEALLALLHETAHFALTEEPKCLRFEIIKPTDPKGNPVPNRLMTNELFVDFDGVEAHRNSPRTPIRIEKIRKLVFSTSIRHAAVLPPPGQVEDAAS